MAIVIGMILGGWLQSMKTHQRASWFAIFLNPAWLIDERLAAQSGIVDHSGQD